MAIHVVNCSQCGKIAFDWDLDCRSCGKSLADERAAAARAASHPSVGHGHIGQARADRTPIPPPSVMAAVKATPELGGKAAPAPTPAAGVAKTAATPAKAADAGFVKPRRGSGSFPKTCPVCSSALTKPGPQCPRCGAQLQPNAEGDADDLPSDRGKWVRVAVLVVLGGLLLGGYQYWKTQMEAADDDERVSLAVGLDNRPDAKEELLRRAKQLSVRPTTMVRVARLCFLTPDKVPTDVELGSAVQGVAPGPERDKKLIEWVESHCKTR